MWQDDRIQAALDGQNPMVMAELPGGFAVFGDVQFLPGYSVLLPKREVGSLNELSKREQSLFLQSMATLGDAILTACEPLRVNYDILGNTDHFLHAHVFPRYQSEVPERLAKPVWLYDPSYWRDPQYQYEPSQHDAIRRRITAALKTTN
ncbi:hypothetical protein HWN39_09560 [Lactobacillus rhamnosus]|uniref:HIT domain-containing protein n=1 Tax=Lacticaseibacillus rhamnosus TaxID=47715 RepID=A0A7Y7UKC5_LACRH|nr:hypothetical protein [Lacticaseibacillus rhamnosus]NVO88751.1 hypothetical protein [Lacticaseibacillus rhamnosus]